MLTNILIFMFMVSCQHVMICSLDPFTVGGVAIASGAIAYNFGKTVFCKFKECCRDNWIKYNLTGIELTFKDRLIAQHLVERIVPKVIKAHLERSQPKKALVLSFHGWTGSGKNFVADIIANHIYKKGINSAYVHRLISGIDFPHPNNIDVYKNALREMIIHNTKICERSMFIFDEMEKMPPGVADVLKPFLDYHPVVQGVDYRKNVFVFLSNTVGDGINKETLRHFTSGLPREDITSKQMEKILSIGSFNLKGGLKDSDLILSGLVDFFVPFLPMEKNHVKECIRAEMRRRNETIQESIVTEVADELEYFPKNSGLFSSTGCKQVAKKLDAFL